LDFIYWNFLDENLFGPGRRRYFRGRLPENSVRISLGGAKRSYGIVGFNKDIGS
jgi:hypothetical protein